MYAGLVGVVWGKRGVTADTTLRLARYFGTSSQLWLGLQTEYDLDIATYKLGDRLKHEVRALEIVVI